MIERKLPSPFVDPKAADVKEHVNRGQQAHFQYFRDDEFWYKTDAGLLFPIPLEEARTGRATFLASEKAIYFMRWIRKYVNQCKACTDENSGDGTPSREVGSV